MKTIVAFITACMIITTCVAAVAQGPAPPPAPMPGNPYAGHKSRSIMVGPVDSQGTPRRVRGEITVTAVPPPNVGAVEIFFDDTSIGKKSEAPYEVQYKTNDIADGPHQFKAIVMGADGKEVWSAITKVEIRNSTAPSAPGASLFADSRKKKTLGSPALVPSVKDAKPANTYSSARYGFTLRYPAGWVTKDQTAAMKPSKPGNAWVSFAPGADKKPGLVVNVRRMQLDPGTDAEMFVKFNPYMSAWERKSILNSQAFATTSSDEKTKQVIHRLIVIKDGYAWMLNCVDTSGKSPDGSRKIFESVVESLIIDPSTSGSGVTVTETKEKR